MTDSQARDPANRPFSRFYEQLLREADDAEETTEDDVGDPGGLEELVQPAVANQRRDA